MKRILSILLVVFMLTVMFTNVVMAADVSFTLTADKSTVDIGDTVTITLTNDSNITVSSGGFFDFTFNDNFELLEKQKNSKGRDVIVSKLDLQGSPSLKAIKFVDDGAGAIGDTSFAYSENEEIWAYDAEYPTDGLKATYTLKAVKAGTVEITCTPVMKAYTGSVESAIADTVTINPVTVTVNGAEPTTYTVTYNANGGTTEATPATVEANGAADLNKTASKDGYTFLGWNTDKDATTALDSYTVTGDVTLYAIYEENPASLLEGVYTRRANSVTIDNTNHTVNVVYDTAQKVFLSTYVGFAPKVADGITVTYSNKDAFISDRYPLTNYTETTSSATNINLAAEKATAKGAVNGVVIVSTPNVYNFNMTLNDGDNATVYAVTLTLADLATSAEFITDEMANTEGFYKAGRTSDIVDIDTGSKVITLTTKNQYNFTTFALNAVTLTGVETAAARQRRTIEVVDADNNIKYITSSNQNVYDTGVLINYNEGEAKEYTIKIYGGENGMSYETYTLKVAYVPARAPENIKIHRVQAVENAKVNDTADINANSAINVTYDAAYDNGGFSIKFVPIIIRGYDGSFMNGEEVVSTSAEFDVCGALRPMYVIDDVNDIPDAMKYRVNYIRDYRDFAVNFIPKA